MLAGSALDESPMVVLAGFGFEVEIVKCGTVREIIFYDSIDTKTSCLLHLTS